MAAAPPQTPGVAGESRIVSVPMVSQRWGETSTPAPPATSRSVAIVGRLASYKNWKLRANTRAKSNIPSSFVAAQPRVTSVQAPAPGNEIVFDGPNESDTRFIPPDSQIAAGPEDLVVAINSLLAIYGKTGNQVGGFQDLNVFFAGLGISGQIYDPRIIYDQADNRFILSAAEVDVTNFSNGNVLIAVSQTSDPTGLWNKYAVNFMGRDLTNTVNTFPDFPGLGLGSNAIYITSNQFALNSQCLGPTPNSPCSFSDAWIKVIGLAELLSGNSSLHITSFTGVHVASGELAFGIQPAVTYGSPGMEFLVSASFAADPGNYLLLFSINAAGTPALGSTTLAVPAFSLPPDAPQPGNSSVIDTGDFRSLNAIWSNGSLWFGQNVDNSNSSGPDARWYQIQLTDLSSASLAQSGDVAAVAFAFYPAISQTPSGTVGVAFTTSGDDFPASAAYTAREAGDPAGTMRGYSLTRIGLGPYDELVGDRWGDYSGISPDPDGSGLWAIAEYAGTQDPHFATAISKITTPPSLSVTPGELDFGGVLVGRPSTPQSATFTNISGGAVTLGMLSDTSPNAADFMVTSDACSGTTLAAGQSCAVTITFEPTQQSTQEIAVLSLDSGSGPVVVILTGSGYFAAVLTVSPTAFNFPPTLQQTASAPATIVVTNTGNATANISVLPLGGPFTQTNNCLPTLAAGASCQFLVVFHPFDAEAFQELLIFSSQAQNSFVNLTGTGIAGPVGLFCPASITFGSQVQGTPSPAQTVTFTNTGSATLTITQVTVTGDYAETDNCSGGLAPRGSCNINVTFTPAGLNSRPGLLSVSDDAPGSPQTVILAGTGVSSGAFAPLSEVPATLLAKAGSRANESRQIIAANRPLDFEPNVGQFSDGVSFVAHGLGYALMISSEGIELGGSRPGRDTESARTPLRANADSRSLKMILRGANPHSHPTGVQERPGKVNFLFGRNPAAWHRDVPTYARVSVPEIYRGVDVVYYGDQHQLEYDFIVAPRANPRQIRLEFEGATDLKVSPSGDLLVGTATGSLRLHRPVVYQPTADSPEQKTYRAGKWEVSRKRAARFVLGPYDPRSPLVIDPVLTFSTYLGGSQGEQGKAIAVDSSQNVYVAGGTYSTDFPVTPNAFQKTCGSQQFPCSGEDIPREDGFVAKFAPDGSTLIYATYLGGTIGSTEIHGLAVDSAGNAYVTGPTGAADYPTTPNSFQPQCFLIVGPNVCATSFVTKLDPSGSALVYSTYLHGTPTFTGANISASDVANAITLDPQGNAYVGGAAGSPDFPTTAGAFISTPPSPGSTHGFVLKLNFSGDELVFSTFIGGTATDSVSGIAVDPSGNIYAAGDAGSMDFPTTAGAFQTGPYAANGFVAKFSPSGTVGYSTLIGGSGAISLNGVAVDSSGSAYVTGQDRGGFPVTPNAFETTTGGAFAAKLHSAGCALLYGTYLNTQGGGLLTSGQSIAVDSAGDAYIAGAASGTIPPSKADPFTGINAVQPVLGSGGFAFVSRLDPTGSKLLFTTPLGGSSNDTVNALALDAAGNIYVTGMATSQDFPDVAAFQPNCTACLPMTSTFGATSFVAKISAAAASGIFLTRPSLTFEPTLVNAMFAQTLSVGLMNNQAVPLNISSVSLSGADYSLPTSPFPCSGSLAPGAGCVISASFLPTSGGPANGMITIQDDGPGSPRLIPLNGVALADFLVSANTQEGGPFLKGSASIGYFVNVQEVLNGSGPAGNVQLSCTGEGAATCIFNPTSVSIGGQSILTVGNLASLSGDSLSFTIVGTLGTQTSTISEQLQLADFTFTAPQASATVSAGQPALYPNLTVAPIGDLVGTISLSCTSLPAHAACTFTPPSLTATGTGNLFATLAVTTSTTSSVAPLMVRHRQKLSPLRLSGWSLSLGLIASIVLALTAVHRSARPATVLLCIVMIFVISCGGSGSSSGSATVLTTPPGSYTITVNAVVGGNLQRSVQISLMVN